MSWWYLVVVIVVWTAISVAWFFANLGNKHGTRSPWWEWVIGTPALVIATALGLYFRWRESQEIKRNER